MTSLKLLFVSGSSVYQEGYLLQSIVVVLLRAKFPVETKVISTDTIKAAVQRYRLTIATLAIGQSYWAALKLANKCLKMKSNHRTSHGEKGGEEVVLHVIS